MRKIILLIIFLLISMKGFASEKVLFIDANNNPAEIKIANEEAKKRGAELIVYPEGKNKINGEQLRTLIKTRHFSSITLSGHSGGLSVYGDKGELNFSDFIEMIQEEGKEKSVRSLYLLGCNTANKSKFIYWKDRLPNIEFVAGFDGTAPLGSNKAGLDFYRDVLSKEKIILANKDKAALESNLRSIKNILSFPTSLFVCDEDLTYYFQPRTKVGIPFGSIDLKECVDFSLKWQKEIYPHVSVYLSGKEEVTEANTSQLKELYESARQIEHCTEAVDMKGFDPTQLIFFRFMKDFHQNFALYYKKDLEELLKLMKSVNSESIAQQKQTLENFMKKKLGDPQFAQHIIQSSQKIDQLVNTLKPRFDALDKQCQEGGDCEEYFKLYGNYSNLSAKKNALSNIKNALSSGDIDSAMERVINSTQSLKNLSPKRLDELKKIDSDGSLKKSIQTIEQLLSNPQGVTRNEMLATLSSLSSFVSAVRGSEDSVYFIHSLASEYSNLSGDVFPYFWYDKTRMPENPSNTLIKAGQMSSKVRSYEDIWNEFINH